MGKYIKAGLAAVAGLLFVSAVLLLGTQCVLYLMSGEWPQVSVLTGVIELQIRTGNGFVSDWLISPSRWIGVHKILDFLPLTLALLVAAAVAAASAAAVDPTY